MPTKLLAHDPVDPSRIGQSVRYCGRIWKIVGINYLQSYDLERFEMRADGPYRLGTCCVLGIPPDHPHYAEVVPDMKIFQALEVNEAKQYALAGGQALHLHRIITPGAPNCFKAAVNRGEHIAHLFDQDMHRLAATARLAGVNVLYVHHAGTDRQHIDMCGKPLASLLAQYQELPCLPPGDPLPRPQDMTTVPMPRLRSVRKGQRRSS